MASTAISAQGSIVQIATGSGGAKTSPASPSANPTILTSSAHGFSNGDVVTFAALTGADAALLNGLTFTVRDKTTNTFAVSVDTTGKTITAGSGTGDADDLHRNRQRQDLLRLRRPGQRTRQDEHEFDREGIPARPDRPRPLPDRHGPGQRRRRPARPGGCAISGAAKQFKLILPSGTTPAATFTAYVKSASSSGGVDQILKRSSQLRISGAIAWS